MSPKKRLIGTLSGLVILLGMTAGEALGASPQATSVAGKQWSAYMFGARLSASYGHDRGVEKQLLMALSRARKFGPKDRRLAETVRELAKFYGHEDKLTGSSESYDKWLAAPVKIAVAHDATPDFCMENVALSLRSYAELLQMSGHSREAADFEARAGRICAKGKEHKLTGLSVAAAARKVRAAGYNSIRSIKLHHGRYEVRAKDSKGRSILLLVNANTGEVLIRPGAESVRRGATLPMKHILSKAKEAGFTKVHFVHRRHGLYAVHGRDDAGRMIEFYLHPSTGKLLRNPKTGVLLTKQVPEHMPFVPNQTVEQIIAKVGDAGYGEVLAVAQTQFFFEVQTSDARGKPVRVYVDPESGNVLPP